jgi:broad specificity phosphatase PhoE
MNDATNMSAAAILEKRPDWQLFRDGCPGGESPAEIGARADRVVNRVRAVGGDVLVFSSGHILRVLAARWLGLEPAGGATFCWAPPVSASLDTSTTSPSRLSGCGTTPVIWIEREHDHS